MDALYIKTQIRTNIKREEWPNNTFKFQVKYKCAKIPRSIKVKV